MASLAPGPNSKGGIRPALATFAPVLGGEFVSAGIPAPEGKPAGRIEAGGGVAAGKAPCGAESSSARPWPEVDNRRKLGGTSIVKALGGLCSRDAGPTGSICDAWRTPSSAADVAACVREDRCWATSPSLGSPGRTLRQGWETIMWPLRGSKRAIRQIFFRGPPTSSQGSQKL